ncbi:two-component system alkaline phosphatase synthesis response regulator PhoP [Keratinibaculum paraultunense]|uniref:Two-component system alkaline phosphatase synthesis response regulator PhoP n=1 Tax=Keratinibaculum paraultunense TaxID=1278232 RepID=A0A4V2UTF3_9FIRM|nr:response regulator transcription factor [Keratinibaculum paraultunense]QQY79074.1 response regulator transcription factor [Keratinibaculum paraultunense]TCS85795.1 two-component system alkaline phosphatase synthesis response regulator PhoP [Keratinibaculum paraultunense]
MYKILIIDDDQDICDIVKMNVEFEGYEAIVLNEGSKVTEILNSNKDIALIVLDIMLPGESGLEILYKIKSNFNIPVFMLTALSSDIDKIKGLRGGAVDYITKPFNNEELRARISSMIKQMKRIPVTTEKIITKDEVVVDCNNKNVTYFNKQLKLTSTEYKIIEFLIANPGRILMLVYKYGH